MFKINIKTNIPKLQNRIRKSIKNLDNIRKHTPYEIARFMELNAKLLAPKLTGNLYNNITNTNLPSYGRKVESKAFNKGFPYNKWVNRSPGFETLDGGYKFIHPKTGKLVAGHGPRTYGQSPSHWTWRGTPGFWNIAIKMTKERYKHIIKEEFEDAIRV